MMHRLRKIATAFMTGLAVLFVLSLALSVFAQKSPKRIPTQPSARQIAEKVMSSLVVITAEDNEGRPISLGSGFVYKRGLVVTNLHVIGRASGVSVRRAGEKISFKASDVIALDRDHDICLIRVEGIDLFALPIAPTKPGIGDEVYVFGNPRGLEGSVSKGIVSSIRTDLGLLQIDASISPGSSGGPVTNKKGELIGVTVSSLVSGQNLNFAVPASFLKSLSETQFPNEFLKGLSEITGSPLAPSSYGVSISTAGVMAVTDRDNARLRGPVRSVVSSASIVDYVESSDRYVEGEKTRSGKVVFNPMGDLVEEWSYNYGELAWKYYYVRDQNGLITQQTWEPAASDTGKTEIHRLSFLEGVKRKLKDVNPVGAFEDKNGRWVYDDLGNNVETLSKMIRTRSISSFDKNGWETENKYYTDGELRWIDRYEYEVDTVGNWVRARHSRYDARFPSLGFKPSSVIYREFTYFN